MSWLTRMTAPKSGQRLQSRFLRDSISWFINVEDQQVRRGQVASSSDDGKF
jgi:hypothetical protein